VNDKPGSLRLRIQKAKDLISTIDRGIKDMRNMNSPLSNENKSAVSPSVVHVPNNGDAYSEA
jgi:hypothetical protein